MENVEPYSFSDAVFIVRLRTGAGGMRPEFAVENVTSGERRTFTSASDVVDYFRSTLAALENVA